MVSLLGVGMFMLGGVGDMIWHTVFGIERHFEVALSIPHLTLKFSALLIGCGPLSAAWRRAAVEETRGWSALWPMVLTAAFVLSGLTYFTGLANPFVYPWAMVGFRAGIPVMMSRVANARSSAGENRPLKEHRDRTVSFYTKGVSGQIVEVMATARRAGVEALGMITEPERELTRGK